MTPPLNPGEVESFRRLIAQVMGIQFEDAKLSFLGEVLRGRAAAEGCSPAAYLKKLVSHPPQALLGDLAQEITVGETYFFRHQDQFHAFTEVALVDRLRFRAPHKNLQILSAGCSSGEEAYSLAVLIHGALSDPTWKVSIRAVDINPAALQKARRARFSNWAFRETPSEVQNQWFQQEGREFLLNEAARASVTFEERNLASDDPDLWMPETYDIVFCRNVLMYFSVENARVLVARIRRSLAPGGYLFLGHAETLRGLSQGFHLCHSHEAFYYQRREDHEPADRDTAPQNGNASAPGPPLAALVQGADTWVDVIGRAAERIHALTRPPDLPEGPPPPVWDLGQSLDLLQKERFSEALERVSGFPPESAQDPDVLLLKAVLLSHSSQFAAAEETCRKLLALDELNAGAHFVLALCREGVGDRAGAAEHDKTAIYLDPGFAMPRLHLGLLARRLGDREMSRRELGQALLLFQGEDSSRLLLFGGGFGREALLSLCETELAASGGRL